MADFGWIPQPDEVEKVLERMPRPLFSDQNVLIEDSGKGKRVLLYEYINSIRGSFPIRAQTIGDCFPPGTMVMGERTKPIEQVRIGDKVWTGEGKLTTVVSSLTKKVFAPLIKIITNSGPAIICTSNHRFLVLAKQTVPVNDKYVWKTADQLTKEDYLLSPKNLQSSTNVSQLSDEQYFIHRVIKIEMIEGPTTVYDIGVADDHHSFLANGYAVHNCVSHGWACGIDVLTAVQIHMGAAERYAGDTATEVIYAGSRVEIGQGRLGRGDGSIGAYAAEFVSKYGSIIRGKYGDIDLTNYDGRRARSWGMPRAGVPDVLEPLLAEHKVRTTSLVRTYEEARDAIASGYPIPVASNQGFTTTRDAKGFARAKGTWYHQMCFIAVDDADSRPGLLCMNSWGENWITGPTRHNQPPGSFWVDAEICTRMLRQGDSFAMSGYEGFPVQELDTSQY